MTTLIPPLIANSFILFAPVCGQAPNKKSIVITNVESYNTIINTDTAYFIKSDLIII